MKSFKISFACILICFVFNSPAFATVPPAKEFYQIRIYHLKDKDQENRMDKFLADAYLPALHKAGIAKVGVFKAVGMDTIADRRIYVLMPLKSLAHGMQIDEKLGKDASFASAGSDFINAAYNAPAYTRMEIIFLEAFDLMPRMAVPDLKGPKAQRIYELRSYESASEKLHVNKVDMFNAGGEVPLFKRLGFNAVFYGRVIAGSRMPNLMYMTTFENRQSRDEHWKAFSADSEWKVLAARAEYKNNVSKNDPQFLFPAEYSDF